MKKYYREREYNKLFGASVDYPGTAGLAAPVKHEGRWHIFIISTEVAFKIREINPFNAGHEFGHILDFENEQRPEGRTVDYVNPDEGRA